jgi:hypothetical protein
MRTPSPKAKDVGCEAKVGEFDLETKRTIHELRIKVKLIFFKYVYTSICCVRTTNGLGKKMCFKEFLLWSGPELN